MGSVGVIVAVYILVYMAILVIICAVGYMKNYRGKTEKEIEEMTHSPSDELREEMEEGVLAASPADAAAAKAEQEDSRQ